MKTDSGKQQHLEQHPEKSLQARAGFTLLELLVVVGIIGLLATITIVALGGASRTSRAKATRLTILKVSSLLDDRQQQFALYDFNDVTDSYGLDKNNKEDQILVRKILAKQLFPQSYPDVGKSRPDDEKDDDSLAAESSEMLYQTLMTGSILGTASAGTDMFTAKEVGDTDGDGRLEFLDAWGRPLRFYRWPTRLVRPGGAATQHPIASSPANATNVKNILNSLTQSRPATMNEDPDDPLGRVTSASVPNPRPYTYVRNFKNTETGEKRFHTLKTWHSMLIVSVGEDEELGLYEPWDIEHYGHLAEPIVDLTSAGSPTAEELDDFLENLGDNITNLQGDK